MKNLNLTISLHDKQNLVFDDAISSNYRTIAVRAGRKWGKTRSCLNVIMYWALENPGIYGYYAPTYPYIRDQIIREAKMIFPRDILAGKSWDNAFSKTDKTLRLVSGSDIIFRSMQEPDAVRPLSLSGLIAEEFSLWSEYAWIECVRPTLVAQKAPVVAIYTPRIKNFVYNWEMSDLPDHKVYHFTSYDGLVSKSEIDKMAAEMSPSVRQTEIYAEWLDNYSEVFSDIASLFDGSLPNETPYIKEHKYACGVDLGRTDDYTVITIIDTTTMTGAYQRKFRGKDYVKQANQIGVVLSRYGNPYTLIDNTGERGGVYTQLKTSGFNSVHSFTYTNNSKVNLIDNLRLGISNKVFTLPHWSDTYDELSVFDIQQTPGGKITYNAPAGYKDDHVNSLALAWQAYLSSSSLSNKGKPVLGDKTRGGADELYKDFNY